MQIAVLRRVLNGVGANAYGQLVTVIVQIVGVPILLSAWGAQAYGEWLMLFAIPGYLSMTDLGFSQSAGNDMVARVVRGDREGALAVFRALSVFVYATAGIGLFLSGLLFWILPLHQWLHLEALDSESASLVLLFLSAEVFAALPNGVHQAGFRANGDYPFNVAITATTRLLQFASVWSIAIAGSGPVAAAAAFFGVRAIGTAVSAVLLTRRHSWIRFRVGCTRRIGLRRLLRPALANVAIPLAQALNIQGMILVVGSVLGPLAVVVFSTSRTLSRFSLQLVLTVSHAAEPELAAAYGARDQALMQSLFLHAQRTGLWLALIAAGGLALFGGLILDIWTHGKVAMHPMLFAFLLLSAVVGALWYGALTTLKATNRHLRATIVLVVSAGAAVSMAAAFLTLSGNLATAGLALLPMDALMMFYAFRAAARLLHIRPMAGLVDVINPWPLINLVLRRVDAR